MGGQPKRSSHRGKNEIMGFPVCHTPAGAGLDLMQNCDLPPPSKVFMGPDKMVLLSMNRVCDVAGKEEEEEEEDSGSYGNENDHDDDGDTMKLLKALQSSQTRAREAEKKVAVLRKERDGLSNALMEEAMQLFACRQQVRLLGLQVSNLQSLWLHQQQRCCPRPTEEAAGSSKQNGHGEEERAGVAAWVLALALSWGIGIGVTTALACRYLL